MGNGAGEEEKQADTPRQTGWLLWRGARRACCLFLLLPMPGCPSPLLRRRSDAVNTSLKVQTRALLRPFTAKLAPNTLGFKFIIPYYEG